MGVGDHLFADVLRPAGDHREHLGREARLIEDIREHQRGHRRQLGRFRHHAVVRGNGGRNLVADHVERVVEGRDRADRGQRLADREDLAGLAVGGEIAGEDLAVVVDAQLTGKGVDIEGAPDLVSAVGHGDAEFQGDKLGQLVAAQDQKIGGFQKDLLTLVAGQFGCVTGRDLEGLARVFGCARRHMADDLAGVGVVHGDGRICADHFACDPHGFKARCLVFHWFSPCAAAVVVWNSRS